MNYCKEPVNRVETEGIQAWAGYEEILAVLSKETARHMGEKGSCLLAVDCYPGVDEEELSAALRNLHPARFLNMASALCSREEFARRIKPYLTDDRVFGRMYYGELGDFQEAGKLEELRAQASSSGLTVVFGLGAAGLRKPDILVCADISRWEIQLRYRAGMPNYHTDNSREDSLKKIKQGYFFEWRIADKHKRSLLDSMDFYLDANQKGLPSMVCGSCYRRGLEELTRKPFRTVPYFDPGVWGGQWMKKVCGLDPDRENYAWSFDGVPEENSLYLEFGGVRIETPAMNLVLHRPAELLGPQVYARFGAEFPIRFDLLDTMGGQNLSLQVHPLTDYIHSQFGMSYTQDESYYILDAEEGAQVYLGLREDVCPQKMTEALRAAAAGGPAFPAEDYVNRFPAKKHDHFLIPAGTVHCSGKGCMVLEISATPYLFTMKLWDWGRLGLDGKPRPIHIDHGEKVIQWDRRTRWVQENLVGQTRLLRENGDYREERTGLHPLEFLETRRYEIHTACELDTENNVNMLNLVEGEAAVVESPRQAFAPFTVHYAETFILPAAAGAFTIRPEGEGSIKVIRAYVRTGTA